MLDHERGTCSLYPNNVFLDYDGVIADIVTPARLAFYWTIEHQMHLPEYAETLMKLRDFRYSGYENIIAGFYKYCLGHDIVINSTIEETTAVWWEKYLFEDKRTPLLPGSLEALKRLRQITQQINGKLAMVTNRKGEAKAVQINTGPYVDLIVAPVLNGLSYKPAPDMILYACQELDIEASSVIMVGDSKSDYQAARNALVQYYEVETGLREAPPKAYHAIRFANLEEFVCWFINLHHPNPIPVGR